MEKQITSFPFCLNCGDNIRSTVNPSCSLTCFNSCYLNNHIIILTVKRCADIQIFKKDFDIIKKNKQFQKKRERM